MLEFYNSKYVIARKDHKCDLCGGLIRKNEKYHRYAGKYNGDFFDNKFHCECQNMINEYCQENHENEYSDDSIADWLHDKYCYTCEQYENDTCIECNNMLCPAIRKYYTNTK